MGIRLFTLIMAVNIAFFVIMPFTGKEYTKVPGDIFDVMLVQNEGRAELNTTTFSNESFSFVADTAGTGSEGVSHFIDPIKTIVTGSKAVLKTIINFAITPYSLMTAMLPGSPLIAVVFGVPLTILYIITIMMFVRGAQW